MIQHVAERLVMAEFSPLLCKGQPLDPFFNVNTPDDLARGAEMRGGFPEA